MSDITKAHLRRRTGFLISAALVIGLMAGSALGIFPGFHPSLAIICCVVLITLFLRWAKSPWEMVGITRLSNWKRTVAVAFGLAFGISVTFFFLIIPGIDALVGTPLDYSLFREFTKDTGTLLVVLPVVWVLAACFEEYIFRGFLIGYSSKLFPTRTAVIVSVAISTLLFGISHSYQGTSGILVTGLAGLLLALIFIRRSCNLIFVVLVHGLIDTIYLLIFYLRLDEIQLF